MITNRDVDTTPIPKQRVYFASGWLRDDHGRPRRVTTRRTVYPAFRDGAQRLIGMVRYQHRYWFVTRRPNGDWVVIGEGIDDD